MQRRGFNNKQRATPPSPSKPELPTSEPPYEVIEFSSQQQYTNTMPPLKNVPKSGHGKHVERKCDLCGCSNAQFSCDVCVQQTFCASCDQMYHRHPKRQMHIRKRLQQPAIPKGIEPPLPPKNELNQAPVPPPRRNKRISRTGTPNSHQGTIKKNGSLMGSLKRFMGGIPSTTPQLSTNRNNVKSSTMSQHSSNATDSDRQSGSRNFGYLDWNANNRQCSDGFSTFNGPTFPPLFPAQSMAQLNCPSCHVQGRSSWDWNRSQLNLNALPPWTGLAAGNPWHGSIIIPPPYPMLPNDRDFVRGGSFHSQRSGRRRRHPQHTLAAAETENDSDVSPSNDDAGHSRRKSPHPANMRTAASPAPSRRSRRRTAISGSGSDDDDDDDDDDVETRSMSHKSDLPIRSYKRRTVSALSRDRSPATLSSRRSAYRRKYDDDDDDDTVSMKSVGSRRSVRSARSSYRRKAAANARHTSSSADSDDELTSDRDVEAQMVDGQPSAAISQRHVGHAKALASEKRGKGGAQPAQPATMRTDDSRRTAAVDEPPEMWECEHCTYHNARQSAVCDVCCKSRRPKPSPCAAPCAAPNVGDGLATSMKGMRISAKNGDDQRKNKGNEKQDEVLVKSISTGTSPPPQTISTQTYDIPQFTGKRNRSLSCDDYSDWNPAKKTNSILSSSSDKQSSSFQQDSSQSSEYIHALLQNHVKHGAEIVKLLKEAELHHFELEDVTAALAQCGEENPIKWLLDNWNKMIDTVVTLATNYGREQSENIIGTISSIEAQAALRIHNGDIWAAVTECIRQRQGKYAKLMSRGLHSREDVVTVLTANHGDLEAAYQELSRNQLRPLLMKIWGPPQGLDNDSGDVSKLHFKDYEYETDVGLDIDQLPQGKRDFERIHSWLDTVANCRKEVDEFPDFEEVLSNLKKQSTSNSDYNSTFFTHLWDHPRNFAVFQNKKLTRYTSCDNLRTKFGNIPNRKKFYASTELLNVNHHENHKSDALPPHLQCQRENNNYDVHLKTDSANFRRQNKLQSGSALINGDSNINLIRQKENLGDLQNAFMARTDVQSHHLSNELIRHHVSQNLHTANNHIIRRLNNDDWINDRNGELLDCVRYVMVNDSKLSKNYDEDKLSDKIDPDYVTSITIPQLEINEFMLSKSNRPHSVESQRNLLHSPPSTTLSKKLLQSSMIETNGTHETKVKGEFDTEETFFIAPVANREPTINHVLPVERNSKHENTNNTNTRNTTRNEFEGEKSEQRQTLVNEYEETKSFLAEEQPEEAAVDLQLVQAKNDSEIEQNTENHEKDIVFSRQKTDQLKKFDLNFANLSNETVKIENKLLHFQNTINETNSSVKIEINDFDHNDDAEANNEPNIPNMISLQSAINKRLNFNTSNPTSTSDEWKVTSKLPTQPYKQRTWPENSILLPELNALYLLAKNHLDYYIIEMKDTPPLHSPEITKIYVNECSTNRKNDETLERYVKEENNEIMPANEIKLHDQFSADKRYETEEKNVSTTLNLEIINSNEFKKFSNEENTDGSSVFVDPVDANGGDEDLTSSDDENEDNIIQNEKSEISMAELQTESNKNEDEDLNYYTDEKSRETKQISNENLTDNEYLKPDEFPLNENKHEESEEEILQKIKPPQFRSASSATIPVGNENNIFVNLAQTEDYVNDAKSENEFEQNEILEISNLMIDNDDLIDTIWVSPNENYGDLKIKNHEDDSNKNHGILQTAERDEKIQPLVNEEIFASETPENLISPSSNHESSVETYDFNDTGIQIAQNTLKEKAEVQFNENTSTQNEDSYNLEMEAHRFLTEGLVSTFDQAELVAQLVHLKFDRSQSIDAANGCSNINAAIVYLQQECQLCAEKFSMKQMISMLECEHKCCQECAKLFFSLQINEKSIDDCVCPFCKEPNLSQLDSDSVVNYFSNLDILLKTILEPQTHELFQQKLRDRTLMQDPSFKWCSKCSFGFIADLDQKRLSCPACKTVSCANCGKLWTKEHIGKNCEQYNMWLATQNDTNHQSVNYLEENGVTCPKCNTKFILVKGGCMHLTCTRCKYEFCSDCFKPFSMGTDCKLSDYCAKLGLHAHHPRNCLFYLRDKEPGELKQLLLENNIEINLPETTEKRCNVQLQKETEDGLKDMQCNAQVVEGGLCKAHYVEYLAGLVRKNKVDPVTILDLAEILQQFRRQGKSLPIRSANSFEHEYRKRCIKMVKEEIPIE